MNLIINTNSEFWLDQIELIYEKLMQFRCVEDETILELKKLLQENWEMVRNFI